MNKKNNKLIAYTTYLIIIITAIACTFICFELKDFFKQNPITPSINEYPSVITNYIKYYGDRIAFFPTDIDNYVRNYYCMFEDSFDGYNIYYLKFKTDKKYIEDTIKKNKNNIYKKIEFNDISKHYKFIDNYFDIKDRNNAFVYILKNKNNDYNYTSGIITSISNEIVFFYANFNIKQDRYWKKQF